MRISGQVGRLLAARWRGEPPLPGHEHPTCIHDTCRFSSRTCAQIAASSSWTRICRIMNQTPAWRTFCRRPESGSVPACFHQYSICLLQATGVREGIHRHASWALTLLMRVRACARRNCTRIALHVCMIDSAVLQACRLSDLHA